jgi:hypothetical protein
VTTSFFSRILAASKKKRRQPFFSDPKKRHLGIFFAKLLTSLSLFLTATKFLFCHTGLGAGGGNIVKAAFRFSCLVKKTLPLFIFF